MHFNLSLIRPSQTKSQLWLDSTQTIVGNFVQPWSRVNTDHYPAIYALENASNHTQSSRSLSRLHRAPNCSWSDFRAVKNNPWFSQKKFWSKNWRLIARHFFTKNSFDFQRESKFNLFFFVILKLAFDNCIFQTYLTQRMANLHQSRNPLRYLQQKNR